MENSFILLLASRRFAPSFVDGAFPNSRDEIRGHVCHTSYFYRRGAARRNSNSRQRVGARVASIRYVRYAPRLIAVTSDTKWKIFLRSQYRRHYRTAVNNRERESGERGREIRSGNAEKVDGPILSIARSRILRRFTRADDSATQIKLDVDGRRSDCPFAVVIRENSTRLPINVRSIRTSDNKYTVRAFLSNTMDIKFAINGTFPLGRKCLDGGSKSILIRLH